MKPSVPAAHKDKDTHTVTAIIYSKHLQSHADKASGDHVLLYVHDYTH